MLGRSGQQIDGFQGALKRQLPRKKDWIELDWTVDFPCLVLFSRRNVCFESDLNCLFIGRTDSDLHVANSIQFADWADEAWGPIFVVQNYTYALR